MWDNHLSDMSFYSFMSSYGQGLFFGKSNGTRRERGVIKTVARSTRVETMTDQHGDDQC